MVVSRWISTSFFVYLSSLPPALLASCSRLLASLMAKEHINWEPERAGHILACQAYLLLGVVLEMPYMHDRLYPAEACRGAPLRGPWNG